MKNFIALVIACVFLIPSIESQIVWEETAEIAPSSFGNHRPRVVTDANDNPLLIWGKSSNVMFSRWDGNSFTTPVRLNPDGVSIAEASWMGPDIAAHGDTVYVVYKQIPEDANPIWCMRSDDGGVTFSAPVRVDYLGDSLSRFPTVTTDMKGNPIVGFMKFNSSFGDPRWVVARSDDSGETFSPDVLAGSWSDPDTEACDCCPGTITSTGKHVAMLYRDNLHNLRDNWAGISSDSGRTFIGGINYDKQEWMIPACPASGPDGVIIGDTLYSTFMNGATGTVKVYFNKSSLSDMNSSTAIQLPENDSNTGLQNFPRIASSGSAVAISWKQVVGGSNVMLPLLFTEDISKGFSSSFDTITTTSVSNSDLVVTPEKVFVFWQDDFTGTVKYRSGTYNETSVANDPVLVDDLIAYPNPSSAIWTIEGRSVYPQLNAILFNAQGALVQREIIDTKGGSFTHQIENTDLISGVYVLNLSYKHFQQQVKLVKE